MSYNKSRKERNIDQQGNPLLRMDKPINQSAISIYSSIFQQKNRNQYEQLPQYNSKPNQIPNDAYYQAANRQSYQIQLQQKYQVNPYYLPNQQSEIKEENDGYRYAKGYQNHANNNFGNYGNYANQGPHKQNPYNIPYPGNQGYHNKVSLQMQQMPKRDYPEINRQSNNFYISNQQGQNVVNNQSEHQIEHKVTPDDTLEGLSLTYGVSITKIKQRNKIETDTIYYLKTLFIPNPQCQYTPQQLSNDVKITHFMGFLDPRDRSQEIAKYYLSQNEWDIQRAVKQYKKDLQWDKNNQIKSIPISQMPNNVFGKLVGSSQANSISSTQMQNNAFGKRVGPSQYKQKMY